MRNERSQQFQYFFDIPVGFEDLQHAQFVEGTLHICVDRFEFPDPNIRLLSVYKLVIHATFELVGAHD